MDAIGYPWEFYIPKARNWSIIGRGKMAPPDAQYVRMDAKFTPIAVLEQFAQLRGISLGHPSQGDLEFLLRFSSLECVCLLAPKVTSLAPLATLSRLGSLELDDPPTLSGLECLPSVRCLVLRHFRRIKSLAPLSALSNLRAISMSTIPSWDASRRCLEVDSLDPLGKLSNLESLCLIGVKPVDRRLDAIQGLTKLKYLHISHEFQFQLEDYAALARALPETTGHCLLPYFAIPQLSLRCKHCSGEIVFLTGPRPRTRRQLCPICDERKLQEHERQWNELARVR
jgi:hypothetical protein